MPAGKKVSGDRLNEGNGGRGCSGAFGQRECTAEGLLEVQVTDECRTTSNGVRSGGGGGVVRNINEVKQLGE